MRTYEAALLPKVGAHCMPVENGCRDAAGAVIAWIESAYETPGPEHIGDGWQLAGSATLCAPEDPTACQGWTWDFEPTFDTKP